MQSSDIGLFITLHWSPSFLETFDCFVNFTKFIHGDTMILFWLLPTMDSNAGFAYCQIFFSRYTYLSWRISEVYCCTINPTFLFVTVFVFHLERPNMRMLKRINGNSTMYSHSLQWLLFKFTQWARKTSSVTFGTSDTKYGWSLPLKTY